MLFHIAKSNKTNIQKLFNSLVGKYLCQSKMFILLIIALLVNQFSLIAQPIGGGYADSYLLRNVGARTIAMAGAFTGIANDPNAVFYNPAGLSLLAFQPTFNTMYSVLEHSRTHSVLSWGQRLTDEIGVGVGLNNFTTGSFIARDVRGNPIGNFTDWQFSFTAAGSYSLEFASIGASLKYLSTALDGSGARADGYSFDLGSKFNILDLFSFGLVVQNIGAVTFWNTESEESNLLPFTVRAGLGFQWDFNETYYTTRSTITGEEETVYMPATRYILVGLDAVMTQHEQTPTLVLGIEAAPHEVIAFRSGIAIWGNDQGKNMLFPMTVWGGGFSLRPDIPDLPFQTHIDYTVSQDHLANNKIGHHISIIFEF